MTTALITPNSRRFLSLVVSVATLVLALGATSNAGEANLLNVSYDITREFFKDYNAAFAQHWKATTGETVTIHQSHNGSSKQARSVVDGLAADVVTMNQSTDIDLLHDKAGLVPADWASRLPDNSAPFFSTIVFVVRAGNPKGIKDWDDLAKAGVAVIVPNPKTSGNGRYSYLAAWGYALKRPEGDEAKARAFVKRLFHNAPVLDTGGRGATTTFAQRGIGDVLLTFESEAALAVRELGADRLEIVAPPVSILAESPVAWVDSVVKKHGTEKLAKAYLEYLYSDAAQELAARHNFRPRDPAVLARHASQFKPVKLLAIAEIAGGWRQAQEVHFSEGGLFDQIYLPEK
jgi:sulfate transport system substrate-binding protein